MKQYMNYDLINVTRQPKVKHATDFRPEDLLSKADSTYRVLCNTHKENAGMKRFASICS